MNHNLQSFEVNGNDPYFTADKWNETLNYSKCFEKMISGILGNKFKGIYKPFEKYNLYDYVWFNDDYYQIIEEKANTVEVFEKQNYDNLYYHNSNYYIGLNPNKKIVNIIGQNEYEVSNLEFDNFYLFDNEIVALKDQNLYRVNLLTKSTNPINYIFSRNIRDVKRDKFQIYILSDTCIEVGNTVNDDLTETKVLYNSDEGIIDFAINEVELLILKSNNVIDIINKSSGELINSFEISQYIDYSKAKILAPDNYSLVIYDGEQLLMFFNNNGQYIYSGNAKNDYLKYGVNTLTERNGYICATNNAGATTYLANRYNLEKADIFSLLINHSKVDKLGVEEYIDFSKGQFETEKLKPEYIRLSVINDKGANITNFVSYNLQNLLNKTIQISIECKKPINEKIFSVNIGTKLCDFSINAKAGKYIYFIDFEESSYRVTSFNNDVKVVEKFNYSSGDNQNKITFSSNTGYILSSFTIFDSIIPFHRKDFFKQNSIQSFDIQASTKSYPFSYVKTDENGNININVPDKSIVKDDNGYKVNFSDATNKTDTDIGLNLKGAKSLWDKVVSEVNKLTNALAPKSHRHDWENLDNVPSATTSQKGIVQLSNSVTGSSEEIAASEKAVKLVQDDTNRKLNRGINGTITNQAQLDGAIDQGVYQVSGFQINGMYGYGFLFVMRNGNVISQYYVSHHGGSCYRQDWNNNISNGRWIKQWDIQNFDPNSKLNVSGGTVNGNVRINGNVNTNSFTLNGYNISITR